MLHVHIPYKHNVVCDGIHTVLDVHTMPKWYMNNIHIAYMHTQSSLLCIQLTTGSLELTHVQSAVVGDSSRLPVELKIFIKVL